MDVPAACPFFFLQVICRFIHTALRRKIQGIARGMSPPLLENFMISIAKPHIAHIALDAPTRSATVLAKLVPFAVTAGLGLVLLYGAAFAATPALHNAAHDGRHSAGFPCH